MVFTDGDDQTKLAQGLSAVNRLGGGIFLISDIPEEEMSHIGFSLSAFLQGICFVWGKSSAVNVGFAKEIIRKHC